MPNNKFDLFRSVLFAILAFLILLFGGSFIYSHVEEWNYLDSLYFSVVTVTTIGYGDLAPQTNIGKIFTIFFSFFGIAMAFYFFTLFGKYIYKKTLKEHHNEMVKHIKLHTHKYYQPKRR